MYTSQSALTRHKKKHHAVDKSSKSGRKVGDEGKASKMSSAKSLEPLPRAPSNAAAGPSIPATTHQSPSFTKEFPMDFPRGFYDDTLLASSDTFNFNFNSMNTWGGGQWQSTPSFGPFVHQNGFQGSFLQNDLQPNWYSNVWG